MIKKFKTFLEARMDLWEMNPDEKYYRRLKDFYGLAAKFRKKNNYPRGLFKFKTFQDAQNFQEELEKDL